MTRDKFQVAGKELMDGMQIPKRWIPLSRPKIRLTAVTRNIETLLDVSRAKQVVKIRFVPDSKMDTVFH